MTAQRKAKSPGSWQRYGLLLVALLGLGALYLVARPMQQRLAAETERMNQEIAARQSAPPVQANQTSGGGASPSSGQETNANRPGAQMQQALNALSAGQIDEGTRQVEAILRDDPKNVDALVLLGDIARQTNRFDKAMTAYQKALTVAPQNAQALVGLGQLYIAVGWPQETRDLLEPAVRASPQDPYLKLPVALAFLQQGNPEKAEALLLEIRRLAPQQAALWSALPRLYNTLNRHKEALALTEEALQQTTGGEQAMLLYEKGKALYHLSDIPSAQATLQQAVALRPENTFARYYLGLCLQRSKQWNEAAQELETVLRQAPNHQEARLVLSNIYKQMGRAADAEKLMAEQPRRKAREEKLKKTAQRVASQPRSADAHWQMARIHEEDKNLPLLVVELRKTLELEPDHAAAQQLLKKTLQAGTLHEP